MEIKNVGPSELNSSRKFLEFSSLICDTILAFLKPKFMAKKSKKTIGSTRKQPLTEEEIKALEEAKKANKGLKKLLLKRKNKNKKAKKEKKVAEKIEPAPKKVVDEKIQQKQSEVAAELNAMSAKLEVEKAQKEAKKEARKEKIQTIRKKIQIKPEHKQKIKGGILALIGLFALTYIGLFLFGKFFRPEALAEILPQDESVAVLELNTDGASDQIKQFYDTLKNYPVYQKNNIEGLMNTLLNMDFAKDVEPWLGRKIGIALIKFQPAGASTENGMILNPVVFIESRDHEITIEKLKARALQESKLDLVYTEYQGFKLYSYTSTGRFHFVFINNYLVIAKDEETIKFLIDQFSKGKKLADDESYMKVANNLPPNNVAFGYIDYVKLFDAILHNDPKFVAEKGQDYLALKPFISLFKADGVVVVAEKGKLVAQEYTLMDKQQFGDEGFLTYNDKYDGKLLSLANPDLVMLAGGHDLTKEIKRLQELFKAGTKTSSLIFDGVLEAQKEQYFGKEISLKDDIYPLLQGEYLITVEKSFEEPVITFFLELKDKNDDATNFEKLVTAFVQTSGIFTPKVKDVTLPDGTKGKEIVASPEAIQRFNESIDGISVTSLQIGNTGVTLYYTIVGQDLVISTDHDNMKNIIMRSNGKLEENFTTASFYQNNIQPALHTADEMVMLKIGALSALTGLSENEIVKPYVLPLGNLTATKNYFADGISSIYQFEIL